MRKVLCFLACIFMLLPSCCSAEFSDAPDSGIIDSGSSLLPEKYNPCFKLGVATDGTYVFFIQQTDDNHFGLFRIESDNDAAPVRLALVETPHLEYQHYGYPPIRHVFVTPDKVYYYALVSVTDDGSYRRGVYEMIQMNKDGTDVQPVDMVISDFDFIGVDGFNLYYEGYGDDDLYCLDLISAQAARISGFKQEEGEAGYYGRSGVYHGAFYYVDDTKRRKENITEIYSVDINSRERKDICTFEGYIYAPVLVSITEGYLIIAEAEEHLSTAIYSFDLSTGSKCLLGRSSDISISGENISVSDGTVYYQADESTVCAVSVTGEHNRYLFRDEIFTGHEKGFCQLAAIGDWLYYKRWMEFYDENLERYGGRKSDVYNVCRIRLDGSFGPVSPIFR